jgi:hypothetical protein
VYQQLNDLQLDIVVYLLSVLVRLVPYSGVFMDELREAAIVKHNRELIASLLEGTEIQRVLDEIDYPNGYFKTSLTDNDGLYGEFISSDNDRYNG